jgi:filamentous hemagglutinin family protein
MNRIYKLIWSRTHNCLVPVAEGVRNSRGKRSPRLKLAVSMALANVLAGAAQAELPTGGQIVSGAGSISTHGAEMTINQSSQRMIANWQSFSIGKDNTVNFVQPDASAVALNRVTGQNTSQILGALNANGQVFLVNPNGIVVGKNAQVRAGGFVGSTLDVSDADFLVGNYRFQGSSGEIRNQRNIEGNVVALIAPTVRNEGTIHGDTALAAGTDVLLDFNGDGLLSVQVNASTLQTLVENKGLIQADGGVAILSARGASEAMKGVVNNTGRIEANSLASQNGRILLLADMQHGEVSAAGELAGHFVETSAADGEDRPEFEGRYAGR